MTDAKKSKGGLDYVTAAQARELKRDGLRYPKHLVAVGGTVPSSSMAIGSRPRLNVWRSRDFLVQSLDEGDGLVRLSINRTVFDVAKQHWRDGITWDEIQRLKREAGFGDRTAIEFFPPDVDLVDVANVRHVWILPIGTAPDFMWRSAASKAKR